MKVVIDPASPVPVFEQLRSQVAALVLGGELSTGSRLPAIRQLASDLGVAAGTVARAYAELERTGVVTTGGARGTRVAASAAEGDLRRAADEYVAAGRRNGVDLTTLLALVRARYP